MLDLVRSCITLMVVMLACFGMGRPLTRRLAPAISDSLAVTVWSVSLGLATSGSVIYGLACGGMLYADALILLSVPGCLWGLVELAFLPIGPKSEVLVGGKARMAAGIEVGPWPAGSRIVLAVAVVVVFAALVVALAPPVSHEVLSRSLEGPKNLLLTHGKPEPGDPFGPSVNLAQMWFLWALALDGPVAVGLLQWCLGLLLALATVLLARVFLPTVPAWLAGCLVLLSPGVQHHLSTPLEDLSLALFGTLALEFVASVMVRMDLGRSAVLGGTALGAALAVQPAAVPLVAALAMIWVVAQRPAEFRGELNRPVAAMGAVALVVAGPWLWQATRLPHVPQWQSLESVARHVGPSIVALVAGLPLTRRLLGLQRLLVPLAIYVLLSVALQANYRWWSIVVPWAAVATTWVWLELDGLPRAARIASTWLLGIVTISCPLARCGAAVESLAVAVGWQSRSDYLLAREPTFCAASLFNKIRRPDDRLLTQDPRGFYFHCPTSAIDNFEPLATGPAKDATDLEHWIALARRQGCSYLLATELLPAENSKKVRAGTDSASGSSPVRQYVESVQGDQVIQILEYCFADDNSRRTRYSLLRLR